MTSDVQILAEANRLLERGTRLALCTVIEKAGSAPREAGTKMVVTETGATCGTIGGGILEAALIDECRKALDEGKARTITLDLTSEAKNGTIDTGLICGGQVTVFIDPIAPDPRLIIVGSGHVAAPLARFAGIVGFGVTVVDNDGERATEERFPLATRVIADDLPSALGELEVRPDDFVVIAHGDPERDYTALKAVIEREPTYVGLLGSRGKVAKLVQRLETHGIGAEALTMLHAPVGVAIGARTPEEIGISILAEIIRHKRGETANSKPDAQRSV